MRPLNGRVRDALHWGTLRDNARTKQAMKHIVCQPCESEPCALAMKHGSMHAVCDAITVAPPADRG